MKTIELEQVIRDYLLDIYKKKYTGKMYITKLNPVGYSIQLELSMRNKPITIYAELEDKAFLKFLKQALKDNRFNLIIDALKYTKDLDKSSELIEWCKNKLVEHNEYIREYGKDMDIITNWKWEKDI